MPPGSRAKGSEQANFNVWQKLLSASNAIHTAKNKILSHRVKGGIESLILAAACSPISQLSLSPVYGSIPASIYHQRLVISTVLLAYTTKIWYQTELVKTLERWVTYVPIVALALPPLQSLLFKQSGLLGPLYGPLVTEGCTYAPVLFLSVLVAAIEFDQVGLDRFGRRVGAVGSASLILVIFTYLRRMTTRWMINLIGQKPIFSRAYLQYAMAAIYTLKFPSQKVYLVALLLAHPLSTNFHVLSQARTAALNETLLNHSYSLVARNESLTGYISVLDNVKDAFRVMRCDHSLLGGEWIHTPRKHVSGLREPIYAIFTMLEAVRLVEPQYSKSPSTPDTEKQALVMWVVSLIHPFLDWLTYWSQWPWNRHYTGRTDRSRHPDHNRRDRPFGVSVRFSIFQFTNQSHCGDPGCCYFR